MKERCKDLIGKRVILLRNVRTNGGTQCYAGEIFEVCGTWHGLYHLHQEPGRGLRKVPRKYFEVCR